MARTGSRVRRGSARFAAIGSAHERHAVPTACRSELLARDHYDFAAESCCFVAEFILTLKDVRACAAGVVASRTGDNRQRTVTRCQVSRGHGDELYCLSLRCEPQSCAGKAREDQWKEPQRCLHNRTLPRATATPPTPARDTPH